MAIQRNKVIMDLDSEVCSLKNAIGSLPPFVDGTYTLDEFISGIVSSVSDHESAYDETLNYLFEIQELLLQKGYEDCALEIYNALYNFSIDFVNNCVHFGMFNMENLNPYLFDELRGNTLILAHYDM